jgi:16S rRNA (cytidine1402-2'-O)-methyltransferase
VTEPNEAGALHVVSTPIGNMGDFSFRAVEVLKSVTLVLAEDTRHTRHLLDHYGIETPLAAYHEHNEARATPGLVARLVKGESIALVSDAGTPLLSDPGARLVGAAVAAGVRVIPVPGASALLTALVASGLDLERFTFFGFLTRTGRARREALDEIANSRHTVVIYESANRLTATLAELEKLGIAARPAVVAREMTKHFEEVQRGTVSELRAYYEGHPPRGEIVLMLGGRTVEQIDDELVRERLRDLAYRLAQASETGEEIG